MLYGLLGWAGQGRIGQGRGGEDVLDGRRAVRFLIPFFIFIFWEMWIYVVSGWVGCTEKCVCVLILFFLYTIKELAIGWDEWNGFGSMVD